jgi:hypothetical protein
MPQRTAAMASALFVTGDIFGRRGPMRPPSRCACACARHFRHSEPRRRPGPAPKFAPCGRCPRPCPAGTFNAAHRAERWWGVREEKKGGGRGGQAGGGRGGGEGAVPELDLVNHTTLDLGIFDPPSPASQRGVIIHRKSLQESC